MRPDAPSPFVSIPAAEWLCANGLCVAFFDRFPVSPGHVLVITRRVVPTWFECTPAEQAALFELVSEVKGILDRRLAPPPDGYNVGFNAGAAAGQTVAHVHVHVIPRYAGDMPDPRGGVRHVIPEKGNYLAGPPPTATPAARNTAKPAARNTAQPPPGVRLSLTTGPDRPLWSRLAERLPGASEIDLLASFVQTSGLDHVRPALFGALAAGARVRLLVGDYLGITSPEALRQLVGWMESGGAASGGAEGPWPESGALEARLVELERLRGRPDSFHPKAWRIADSSGGIVVVGSSNLSRAALESGVEWNLVGETAGDAPLHRELAAAFADLWEQATPLSADVVERYAARATAAAELRRMWDDGPAAGGPASGGTSAGGTAIAAAGGIEPRPWQRTALASLAAIRAQGYSKALVAVATGLGKTWLAAFDAVAIGTALGRLPRVLVVAHRAEILAQAEATLRAALAEAARQRGWAAPQTTWFVGDAGDLSGSLVIASIQKLSRPAGLAALDAATRVAGPFDSCVIDEVHHAEAPSYRRALARLRSAFTLGLTATPERTDGVDVATLFDDILAAQATIGDGIAEGALVPFRYRGLKDDVDFERIPWRGGRFDVGALEVALENSARMERLWAEWQATPAGRTLVFCCSRRHALFARDWLEKRGVAAAAVFSDGPPGAGGPVSDPRMASLAAFHAGSLAALCVVDLFNEGVDIPLVDRVVMLRPTESKVVFLQQLGRGLRSAAGKTRLEVIDFVGNHRVFASRIMHLFALVPADGGDAAGFTLLRQYLRGATPELPPGCLVDVDIEAKNVLARFLPAGRAAVEEAYRSLRAELGRRPTPTELVHAGYLPRTVSAEHGSWFGFVQREGDFTAAEAEVATRHEPWLSMLQTTSLNKSYKMVVLRVLLDRDALWSGMTIPELAAACRAFLENHPALRADLDGAAFTRVPGDPAAEQKHFADWWLQWPLSRWMDEQAGRRWFTRRGERFLADFTCPAELQEAFETLSGELIDEQLARYTRSRLRVPAGLAVAESFRAKVIHSRGKPFLKLPTVDEVPGRPAGPVLVRLPDGREWEFRFVKIACNVAGPRPARGGDPLPNELPVLLREWFGPDAGLPGTNFDVEFHRDGDLWHVSPLPAGTVGRQPLPTAPASAPSVTREDPPPSPPLLLPDPAGGSGR
ncbi:MAG: HIT domain-containing protein, partial [Planctomycetia bacterium]|nr:HIT domain-containing protein [Planctomycetia bacterium]